jgi:hypothetical protein
MTQPVRLQLSRRAGFDLQSLSHDANSLPAVVVARPTKWGNPCSAAWPKHRPNQAGPEGNRQFELLDGVADPRRAPSLEHRRCGRFNCGEPRHLGRACGSRLADRSKDRAP